MRILFQFSYCVTALFLMTLMCQAEERTHEGINPETRVSSWKASNETYSKFPITTKLEPDFRVDLPDFGRPGESCMQRRTDRTYGMMCNGIASPEMITLRRRTLNHNAG